ncbi:MAG: hypothetical protein N3D85_07135 [Candidatus Bathyarchaeota archaeon]|nr:hypothetical protein [Candidatus Bathyarchaeota archaeon]
MNWKKVVYLIRVERKAGRLLRGQRLIKYNVKRSRVFGYILHIAVITVGLIIGLLLGYFFNNAMVSDSTLQKLVAQGFRSLLFSLSTLVLIFSLVFTMLMQIQRSGIKLARQVLYWLPVTWQEHTLAAILAEMLGFPILAVLFIGAAVLPFSFFVGQTVVAVGSVLAMLGAAFTASATTEILRILQVRFVGAVYKSTGRGAVWVRFAGSIMFFIFFYVIYFYITSGANALYFVEAVSSAQSTMWLVPYVWFGVTLFFLTLGWTVQGIVFLALSVLFMTGLFFLATELNRRFGLYEPPVITISRGVYIPKTGVLGKFGFSTAEAALIHKDFKAFTRRRELMGTFIAPIIFLLIPIMSTFNTTQSPSTQTEMPLFMFAFTTAFPAAIMAMSMGNFMTGEEGQNVWRIYASPISAKNFVKSKYVFLLALSLLVLPITGAVSLLIYQPSFNVAVTVILEAVLLVVPIGLLSLANGIKGADFTEVPRPRMIRSEWSLINMIACSCAGLAVLAPLLPHAVVVLTGIQWGLFLNLPFSIALSATISAVLTAVFYHLAVGNAKEFLSKSEA